MCFTKQLHSKGYDMEDAMVINRASLQRGFANGQVYKSEFVDLAIVFKTESSVSNVQFRENNDLVN